MAEELIQRIANGLGMAIKKLTAIEQRLEIKPIGKEYCEINTLTTFLKAKSCAFNIEKVRLDFVEFDKATNKLTSNIELYMGFGEALVLSQDILSGRISKLAVKEKAKGEKYPKAIWQSKLGGVNEENAKKRNLRTDGKAISRYFTIAPGSKAEFVITAEQKAGKSAPNGIITPCDGKPEKLIRVACSGDDLKSFALLTKAHIEGYISSQYANNGYARETQGTN